MTSPNDLAKQYSTWYNLKKLIVSHLPDVQLQSNQFAPSSQTHAQEQHLLPPYLGEMGLEVLWFLGHIEPLLRAGWAIPARRPELYPEGTAFAAPELFAKIKALMDQFQAVPIVCNTQMNLPLPEGGEVQFQPQESGLNCQFVFTSEELRCFSVLRTYEKKLKKIIGDFVLTSTRPAVVPWDDYLTSVYQQSSDPCLRSFPTVAKPSYQPHYFVQPCCEAPAHIGVQLRAYRQDARQSEPKKVLPVVEAAAKHLGLQLFFYGDPKGTVHYPDSRSTYQEAERRGFTLLQTELSYFKNCQLMFAPFSGWCDLMAWLQVPTLVEKITTKQHWAFWQAFAPRIAILDFEVPIGIQIDTLLSQAIAVPTSSPAQDNTLQVAGLDNPSFF